MVASNKSNTAVLVHSDFSPQALYQRNRLLKRLLAANINAVSDAELLELVLASAPAHEPAKLAIRLLERFVTLNKVFYADEIALKTIEGVDAGVIQALALMQWVSQRMIKSDMVDKHIIQSWSAMMDYCKLASGHGKVEEFRVLFLNHRHALIADEVMQRGTINHTPVYPREIAKRALDLSAAAVILVHNHPSGDFTPSKADIDITHKIVAAAAAINVAVHDHVIVTETGHYSFKSYGLMPEEPAAPPVTTGEFQYSLF